MVIVVYPPYGFLFLDGLYGRRVVFCAPIHACFNDTLAIRREEHPSLRLNESETAYFFAHRWSIVLTRLLIAAICLCALSPIINYQLSIINYQLSIINVLPLRPL